MKFLENANFDWMEMLNFHERPFRAKFIPAKVWSDLDNYRNDSKGLSNYFRKWRTKIEFRPETSKAKWAETHVACGGEYDPNERQCTIHIYTSRYETFKFTPVTWCKFKYRLIQITMHELIHFMQFDRRGDEWSNYVVPYKKIGIKSKDAERKYLSEFDEIQAYAHCVLLDFKTKRPNVPIQLLLARCKTHRDSSTIKDYLRCFNYDFRNNQALPKLLQQVMKWERKYEKTLRRQRRPK